jgi:hypothetical protein
MTEKKRVIAEITLSHLMRLGDEHGCPVNREQARAFLNQERHAYEMWMHMMEAAGDFIACSLLRQYVSLVNALAYAFCKCWHGKHTPPVQIVCQSGMSISCRGSFAFPQFCPVLS